PPWTGSATWAGAGPSSRMYPGGVTRTRDSRAHGDGRSAGLGEGPADGGRDGGRVFEGAEVAEAGEDLGAGVGEAGRLQLDEVGPERPCVLTTRDDDRAVHVGEA